MLGELVQFSKRYLAQEFELNWVTYEKLMTNINDSQYKILFVLNMNTIKEVTQKDSIEVKFSSIRCYIKEG